MIIQKNVLYEKYRTHNFILPLQQDVGAVRMSECQNERKTGYFILTACQNRQNERAKIVLKILFCHSVILTEVRSSVEGKIKGAVLYYSSILFFYISIFCFCLFGFMGGCQDVRMSE